MTSLRNVALLLVVASSSVHAQDFKPVTDLDQLKWNLGKWKATSIIDGPFARDLGNPGDELTIDVDIRRENRRFFAKRVTFTANGKSRPEEIVIMGVDPKTKQVTLWGYFDGGGTFIGRLFSDGNGNYKTRSKVTFGKGPELSVLMFWKVKDADTYTNQFVAVDDQGKPLRVPGIDPELVDTFKRQK